MGSPIPIMVKDCSPHATFNPRGVNPRTETPMRQADPLRGGSRDAEGPNGGNIASSAR